ncbi:MULTISPECIES: TonB-dependent receptor domain-containing protein [Thioclava]|uniref:TonB-dependent receptor domain-containing protein n=1 Tax=Thioclava TaxID=285107 RepID=UPI0023A802A5|nr:MULTISPECIES: TonB-dependent receptor [Thioclava]
MATTPRAARMRLFTTVTSLALIAAAGPALAQESGSDDGYTMLGRLIYGWGTPKVAIDTPQAVTVIDQQDLDEEQPRTMGDLFADVPGVQAAGASARMLGQAFNIRGIGNAEQTGSQNRIIITVDGAVKFFEQYRTGSFFGDPELYKRVEVLRGPASSTMYGSGAIGGVVNFTTKDATDFIPEGQTGAVRLKGAYDSNGDGKIGTVTYAQKLGEDANMLFSYSRGSSDDMEDGGGETIPATAGDRWSALLKSNYYFGENRDQRLTFSASRTDSDLKDAAVAQTGGALASAFGTSDLHAIDDTLSLTYANEGVGNPWLDLEAQLSYSKTSTERDNFSLGMMCSAGRFSVLCPNTASYETTALKLENTVEMSRGAWENYLTFGTQLSHQNRYANSSVGEPAFHPGGTEDKLGLYVQGEFVWNDKLTITPGLRVDRAWLSPDAAAAAQGGTDQDGTAVSPKIAALYQFNDTWGVFGSLARTERMPTLDELYQTDGIGAAGRTASLNLDKEKATTVELGVTYQTSGLLSEGDSLSAKATLFHNDLTDLIAANPSGSVGVPYFRNVDSAKIWGGEIEASYEADRWFGQLAYSKVKSKDEATGQTLTDTPAENIALTLGAKFPDQGVRAGWRVQGFSGIETASASTSAPGYATHDLFVSWKPERLAGIEVNLTVENVFDREYRNNLSLDNAPGRNVKLAVAKAFTW